MAKSAPTSDLVWKRVEQASRLLGVDPSWILSKAGVSESNTNEWRSGQYTPSLSRLTSLSEKTGLPVEFFLSNYEPTISHARFRAGSESLETESEYDEYYLRREVLRLGALADLLVPLHSSGSTQALIELRQKEFRSAQDLGSAVLHALSIRPEEYPLGPRLLRSLDKLGITLIFYPLYTKAHAIGLSWWQTRQLPIITVASWVRLRRAYFTIAHEILHLLKHLSIDGPIDGFKCRALPGLEESGDYREERIANQFAAEILMPTALRDQAAKEVKDKRITRAVNELSREWDVSMQAVALRLVSWKLVPRDQIESFFVKKPMFPVPDHRSPVERFGTPARTRQLLTSLHESGSSARYLSWATKIPLDTVLRELGRLRPQEACG
jgi:Zn-dependent peptidase ImmA (M78 family)